MLRGSCAVGQMIRNILGLCSLTVCIKKGQNFSLGHAGTQQPGGDQTLPLWLPHHTDNLKLTHEHFKLFL